SNEEVKDAIVYGWESIKNEEDRRMAKIRWLLGHQDGSTSAPPLEDMRMPESLLREDDVSYENMKASVEKCFGLPSLEAEGYVVHRFLFLLDSNNILQDVKKNLMSVINSMSCTGLLRFANKVTGGSVLFEKTRFKMGKIILKYLKKIPRNPEHRDHKRFIEELPELLKNPSNFKVTSRVQLVDSAYLSHHSAARKILEGLEEMDCPLLAAMIRRLEGGVRIPKFGDKLKKKFSRKDKLIAKVRKLFNEELCEVSADDKLPIKLAKSMSVAVLGLKMKLDNPEIFFPEFCSVSAYIKVIHGDLLKSIRIINDTKLFMVEDTVERLRSILDPISNPKVTPQQFRVALKRWLIDYLFECNEIPEIPDSVEKTINIINYMHQKQATVLSVPVMCTKKKQANEEVEILGNLSAQYKQIMLDKTSDYNMDEDYNDAYLKDVEVNSYAELLKDGSNHSDESVGECETNGFVLPELASGENTSTLEDVRQDSSDGAGHAQKPVNKYLAIQEICDQRSLEAYNLIGLLLEKKLDEEGVELDESKKLYLRGGRSDH
ncbi:hypothetical protein MKX01_013245, partial [Papaver californicum]